MTCHPVSAAADEGPALEFRARREEIEPPCYKVSQGPRASPPLLKSNALASISLPGVRAMLPLLRRKVTQGDCSPWNTLSKTQTNRGYAPVAGTFGPSSPIEVRSSTCAAGAYRTLVTRNTLAFLCSSAGVTKQESQTQASRPIRRRKSVSGDWRLESLCENPLLPLRQRH
jgi:hypothetical protein